ncbi:MULTISPECIES: polyprenol monophosphomannose synthase [Rhodopirellula]|uniref:polyprenol monophosphomannose synthase n=1 Tax=Rhodopirellula TaxID=265488 RepID=UPI0025801523|nr:polyprenol monophosphomannose synthase [Rhodopirellula sp. UBA1907]
MPHSVAPDFASGQRILVGICTYNEAANVKTMLTKIREALPNAVCLVVDDDSPDGTAEIARRYAEESGASDSVLVKVRKDERGLGGAIRAAMQTAIDGKYDLFCNMDADLSHDPADLPRLVSTCLDENADVVVGSRYIEGGAIVGWPWRRKVMSGLINGFTRKMLRLPVRDASGSYRCYRVRCLAGLDPPRNPSDGYAFIQEVLLRLHRDGAKCVEVPITFTERVHGTSKLNFREAMRSSLTVFRLLAVR